MQKVFVAILGVLFITGITFAGGDPESVKVEVKKAGFSIMLPSGFTPDQGSLSEGTLWLNVDLGEGVYVTFYIDKMKGKYDTVKKKLEKNFAKESFDPSEADMIKAKVLKKAACVKKNGIEFCSAEFEYDYFEGLQHAYFCVFKTKKGAYRIFFAASPETYDAQIDAVKEILATIKPL